MSENHYKHNIATYVTMYENSSMLTLAVPTVPCMSIDLIHLLAIMLVFAFACKQKKL